MSLLRGIDRVRDVLMDNTERFAKGLPANNALLWGARGMGKSSLVKASHAAINAARAQVRTGTAQADRDPPRGYREPARSHDAAARRPRAGDRVLRRPLVRRRRHDLQVAQGGARRRHRGAARQRHLLRDVEPPPPDAARNDGERALDRDQSRRGGRGEESRCPIASASGSASTAAARTNSSTWWQGYVKHYRIPAQPETLRAEALEWATTRGSRSGRVAWQYVQDLAGRLGVPIEEPAAPR